MLMLLIAKLSTKGFRYHERKTDKCQPSEKRYVYHVCMMKLYRDILKATVESFKIKDQFIRAKN